MTQSSYLSWINEAQSDQGQKEAISRGGDEHCIVIAGPGTGKTRTLVLKAAKLLNETIHPPRGLACVTYAHLMAEELRQRLFALGVRSRRNLFVGTLHGFSLSNILIPFGRLYHLPLPDPLMVASDRQQAEIYREIWDTFEHSSHIREYQPESRKVGESVALRLPIRFQEYRRTQLDGNQSPQSNVYVEELLDMYEVRLLNRGLTDFDLQIKWAMKLVEEQEYVRTSLAAKYPWILIDEYQDLGLPLHRMVLALTTTTDMKLFAIGDPNQCIYEFSGASPEYLRQLEMSRERYGVPIYLTRNYRSLQRIVEASSVIIQPRVEYEAVRQDGIGYVGCRWDNISISAIIQWLRWEKNVPYHQIMVLNRRQGGCTKVIDQIEQEVPEIPCFKAADQLYDSRKPLIEWLENLMIYSVDGPDSISFEKLCEFWKTLLVSRRLSKGSALSLLNRVALFTALQEARDHVDSLSKWLAYFEKAIDLEHLLRGYESMRPDDVEEYERLLAAIGPRGPLADKSLLDMKERIERRDRVFVGTLHSSKGQEREAIIITEAETLNSTRSPIQEQNRRLFYVGITRAKDWLFVLHNGRSYYANQLESIRASNERHNSGA